MILKGYSFLCLVLMIVLDIFSIVSDGLLLPVLFVFFHVVLAFWVLGLFISNYWFLKVSVLVSLADFLLLVYNGLVFGFLMALIFSLFFIPLYVYLIRSLKLIKYINK